MPNKILVISTTPFYGGGESFVANTLSCISENMAYYVSCKELFDRLGKHEVYKFNKTSILGQINEVNHFLKNNKDIDCVLFNGGNTIFFVPFVWNVRKIFYRHTTNMNISNCSKRIVYILLWHICYFFCDKIIHVSSYSLKEQKFFLSKAICIHHGVVLDTPRKIRKDVHSFLYVGRLDKSKGIDIIVEAFTKLPKGTAKLNIVGSGDMNDYISALDNSDIHYWGFQSDVSSFYKNADVFVTLPTNEAFGLTIIEAMKYSLPVITCDIGGIKEINRINGFLVIRNVESVYKAMQEMQTNKELYSKMSFNAYSTISSFFTHEETVRKLKRIILSG